MSLRPLRRNGSNERNHHDRRELEPGADGEPLYCLSGNPGRDGCAPFRAQRTGGVGQASGSVTGRFVSWKARTSKAKKEGYMESQTAIQPVIEGARRFADDVYPQHRDLYERLSTDSTRRCCSSLARTACRSNKITQASPGDLFIHRNPGNIASSSEHVNSGEAASGEAASIEYAVKILGVTDIVVCAILAAAR